MKKNILMKKEVIRTFPPFTKKGKKCVIVIFSDNTSIILNQEEVMNAFEDDRISMTNRNRLLTAFV